MARRPWLALVLACAVVAACSGGDEDAGDDEAAAWATAAELRWFGRLKRWNDGLVEARSDVAAPVGGDEFTPSALLEALGPFARCSRALDEVGPAPSARLAYPAGRFRTACGFFERYVDRMERAVSLRRSDLLVGAKEGFRLGARIADAASGALPPSGRQPLPREGGTESRSRIEPALSRVAGRLARREVEVRCWSRDDWSRLVREERALGDYPADIGGLTRQGGRRIHVSPSVCAALVDLHYRGRRPTDPDGLLRLADAVDTLTHESAHAAGVVVEAKAECHGIQRLEQAARDLGAAPGYAAELERTYWGAYDALDAVYRSPECADGGDFDLRPGSDEFP